MRRPFFEHERGGRVHHGFLKVAAVTFRAEVSDVTHNTDEIIENIKTAAENGAKLAIFPELCMTGYTAGDLFLQKSLQDAALGGLSRICKETANKDIAAVIGLPFEWRGRLYNCAAVVCRGTVIGLVPKTYLPNYGEFDEERYFSKAPDTNYQINISGQDVPFGKNLVFECENMPGFTFGVEICEDLSSPHKEGAIIIANPSAENEVIGRAQFKYDFIKIRSKVSPCAVVHAAAGEGESTTDLVFAGQNLIFENGSRLALSKKYSTGIIYADIDTERLLYERLKTPKERVEPQRVYFKINAEETRLDRVFSPTPFVPSGIQKLDERCEEILTMQAAGLAKRLAHTKVKTVVIGISGGLDSTLALLVSLRAVKKAGLDKKNILGVTMPCFGTSERTYKNARGLCEKTCVSFMEIDIKKAVTQHFDDIGHNPETHDTTYENAQARERTQVLMDLANKTGGLVVGTGDMSELALGWATYGGDQISMYGVNSSVPKTLIGHLIGYEAKGAEKGLDEVLRDILKTPVSPELLPAKNGEISQYTEDFVGPYRLHDFFLYYMLRFGMPPSKIYRIAKAAFEGEFSDALILKWMKVFYSRFFTQQFKRSCMPDGPKIGMVGLSPRGGLRMPSDASARLWLDEIEKL